MGSVKPPGWRPRNGVAEHSTLWTVLTAVAGILTAAGVYQVPNAALPAAAVVADLEPPTT